MTLDPFDAQIAARRENETRMFKQALSELACILEPRDRRHPADLTNALTEIVSSLGGSIPQLPEDMVDANDQLEYLLRPSGIMRRRVNLVGPWWKDAVGCMLGTTRTGQVVALLPGNGFGYTYRDQDGRIISINRKTAKNLNSDAFCFYRPLPVAKLGISDLLLFMLQTVTLADILFVLGSSALVSILGLFLPFMNKILFDRVVSGGMEGMLPPVAALLLGITVGTALFTVTRGIILTRLQNKINLAVQSAAMMRLLVLPASFFKDYSAGELSARLKGIQSLCSTLSNVALTAILTGLFSLVYLFQIASFAPSLVFPTFVILSASLGVTVIYSFLQFKVSRRRMNLTAKLNGLLFALFSGIQKIKLTGSEKRAFAQWAALYKEQGKLTYAPPVFLRIHSAVGLFVSGAGTIWLFYTATRTGIPPADFMAFHVSYGVMAAAMVTLGSIAAVVADIRPTLEMVQPFLETMPETSASKKVLTSLSGLIEINNLTFRYHKDGPAILENFDLTIRRGEYVALVGKTGCGKSTLMRLLLGFEKPESGAIYYDGHDLEHLDLQALRRCIGVNLQNGKLFPGDIFSNIVLTAPWKTLDDAWEAARLAGIDEDIKALPMGMHTMISEGSGGISGGQRQRLLIARAIVSKPNILVFDEATSALDNITQKRIADSIGSLECTRLIIAHRLSTVRHSDRIVVIDGGRTVEEGSYETLMARKGAFYELAVRQTL